uniref:Hydroxysteroid dehydrogenase like 2 n=1 Tax=Poecilia reticulata TaxID=8081 RepID=A0A3P9PUW8_POERE
GEASRDFKPVNPTLFSELRTEKGARAPAGPGKQQQEARRLHALHHGSEPRHREGHRPQSRPGRRQRGDRRQDGGAAPEASWDHLHGGRRSGGGRREGAALRRRHPGRAADRGGRAESRGNVWGHRHPGEQRQRHQPDGNAGDAHEEGGPDAGDQPERDIPDRIRWRSTACPCASWEWPKSSEVKSPSTPCGPEPRSRRRPWTCWEATASGSSAVRQTSWRTPPTPFCPSPRTTRVTSWWTRTSSRSTASKTSTSTPSSQVSPTSHLGDSPAPCDADGASDWSTGHPLLPDFFLDEAPETLVQQMEQHGATPAFKAPPSDTPLSGGPIGNTFDIIRGVINEDVVKATQGVYRFDLSGDHSGVWFLDLKSGSGSAGQGEPPAKADVVMTMDSGDFAKMFAGQLKPTMAFMTGKLRIKGDMTLAIKLEKLMGRMSKAKL